MTQFKDLLGKTLTEIENAGTEVYFTTTEGRRYMLHHTQDCCERVSVEDVVGDLQDLIGTPLTMAEEIIGEDDPEGFDGKHYDSYTWTFYKLATVKGYVTIRWLGRSNGYYSERVDFDEI